MAKTQNHECKVTKGHKHLERNGEEGPFMGGTLYKLVLLPLTETGKWAHGCSFNITLREKSLPTNISE